LLLLKTAEGSFSFEIGPIDEATEVLVVLKPRCLQSIQPYTAFFWQVGLANRFLLLRQQVSCCEARWPDERSPNFVAA
jgi:hypothetical protein